MNAIFLDIDGVLNDITSYEGHKTNKELLPPLEEKMLKNLVSIIKKTNAKIILSSSLRINFKNNIPITKKGCLLEKEFSKYGIYIYDSLDLFLGPRGLEMSIYLKSHPEINNYIILDDYIDDMKPLPKDVIIQTWFSDHNELGLCQCQTDQAIKTLSKTKK